MKTDKEIFIENFNDFCKDLPDELDISLVWFQLRKRGNSLIRNNRRFGEANAKRAYRLSQYPISVDGVAYRNIPAVVDATGFERHTIRNRLSSPGFPTWIDSRRKKRVNGTQNYHYGKKALRVNINGVAYDSITQASTALNMSVGSVYHRLHSEAYPDWKIA